jgi:hypothetical protein
MLDMRQHSGVWAALHKGSLLSMFIILDILNTILLI